MSKIVKKKYMYVALTASIKTPTMSTRGQYYQRFLSVFLNVVSAAIPGNCTQAP